jgi:hypothetical protein
MCLNRVAFLILSALAWPGPKKKAVFIATVESP